MKPKSRIDINNAFEYLLEKLESESAHVEQVAAEFSEVATDFRNQVRDRQARFEPAGAGARRGAR